MTDWLTPRVRRHVKEAPDATPRPHMQLVRQVSDTGRMRTIHVSVLRKWTLCGLYRRDRDIWRVENENDEITCGNCLGFVNAIIEEFGDGG